MKQHNEIPAALLEVTMCLPIVHHNRNPSSRSQPDRLADLTSCDVYENWPYSRYVLYWASIIYKLQPRGRKATLVCFISEVLTCTQC